MAVLFERFAALALAVEPQLHLFGVAEHLNFERLPFATGPSPMGKYVQHGLRAPPGLEVVVAVFGEAAAVEDAELRADRGKAERIRFTAVVEAGPVKEPRQVRARRV